MKKALVLIMALVMIAGLVACGDSSTPSNTAAPQQTTTAQVNNSEANDDPEGGFTEITIWEDEEVADFLNVNGVFFQPVPMSGGNENFEDYDLHFEADVSTLPNDLGYGVGEWVPYMTVDFELTAKSSGEKVTGTFMPMNADDGPHYGANIKMPGADTYSVKLTFHSPGDNGYLIHLDDETGPGGKLEDLNWPLVLELPDIWNYTADYDF